MQSDEDDQSDVIKSCQERHGPPIKQREIVSQTLEEKKTTATTSSQALQT